MQINQYTNEATIIRDGDFLDIDQKTEGAGYVSTKISFSNLKDQLLALFGSPTLQGVYDNSVPAIVELDDTNGAFRLRNNQSLLGSPTQEWANSSGQVVGVINSEGQLEVATTFITVDLMDSLTFDFYPRNSMSIQSITDLINAPTTTLLLNDVAYILGSPIVPSDKVTITVSTASVVVLNIINVL